MLQDVLSHYLRIYQAINVLFTTVSCIPFIPWLWEACAVPAVCLTLLSHLSVIDNSWEKPNQEKVRALQLPAQQRHWHREHPGGPREEVRGRSWSAASGRASSVAADGGRDIKEEKWDIRGLCKVQAPVGGQIGFRGFVVLLFLNWIFVTF